MKKLIYLLFFYPLLLRGQEVITRKDSIEYTFALRDSIAIEYDSIRYVKSERYSPTMMPYYIDSWLFLNYKLLCWKNNKPFTYEGFMYHKAINLYKNGGLALFIEYLKITKFD